MDKTQSSKSVIEILYEKKNLLISLLAVLIVAAGGYYGWSFLNARGELKAMDAYSRGEKLYQAGLGAADFANNSKDPKAPKTQVDQSQALSVF